jgi:hypothetical protein
MFTLEELKDLIHLVAETGIGGVEVEGNGTRLRIDGVPTAPHAEMRGGASLLPPALATAATLGPTVALPGIVSAVPSAATTAPRGTG